ncbi:MAG: MazG nucleotide pyrophosphohydrolase domain-containing protein [Colwellia sp.]|nr:MazG nucleotide pyrophosphohydrolase domain-containing protein [Colwellia sp.]
MKQYFEKLMDLSELKLKRDLKGTWSKGSSTYFKALFDELDEVSEELHSDRQCYLEDELGDVLWDYLCLLKHLENEKKVDINSLLQRANKKYDRRITGITNGEEWDAIKSEQKQLLKIEQKELSVK